MNNTMIIEPTHQLGHTEYPNSMALGEIRRGAALYRKIVRVRAAERRARSMRKSTGD